MIGIFEKAEGNPSIGHLWIAISGTECMHVVLQDGRLNGCPVLFDFFIPFPAREHGVEAKVSRKTFERLCLIAEIVKGSEKAFNELHKIFFDKKHQPKE